MGDLMLLACFLALVGFGYYVMVRLDRFLAGLRGDGRPFLSRRLWSRGRFCRGWRR